jgi:hypothetical protein
LANDGSTDKSGEIAVSYARRFPDKVHYLTHPGFQNKGMSASRNLGVRNARGTFVAFLDADDIWIPQKLERQVSVMRRHPEAGMVANPALYWYQDGVKKPQPMALSPGMLPAGTWIPKILESDNNAACPSSVLIRTALLKQLGGFEESFRGPLMVFEDQVTWFKISLAASVYFDPKHLIWYRIHADSCCMSTPADQQHAARIVLYSRLADLLRKNETACAQQSIVVGMARTRLCEMLLTSPGQPGAKQENLKLEKTEAANDYRNLLGSFLFSVLMLGTVSRATALRLCGKLFDFYQAAYYEGSIKALRLVPAYLAASIRKVVPGPIKKPVRELLRFKRNVTARARLALRIRPLSEVWGSDRGLPVHRYYLAQFLREFSSDVRGHCLEFQRDTYTRRLNTGAVTRVDILHIDDSNPEATIVADLTRPNEIPSEQFDCIICTHVLHVIPELDKAVAELYRILKPGGVLLTAVPQTSMYDPGWRELWRFTPEGLLFVLSKSFGKENVQVRGYGNSLTAACEIRGVVSDELSKSILDHHDVRFSVEVCARAVKPMKRTDVTDASGLSL